MNSHSLLSALMDHIEEPVLCYDQDGRYVFANRAATRYTGLSVEQMLGRTDTELFGPSSKGVETAVKEFFDLEVEYRGDHEITLNGKTYLFSTTVKQLIFEGQKLLCMVCRDVAEERAQFQELLERNNIYVEELENQKFLFEKALRCNPYAMAFANTKRELIIVNDAFAELFGFDQDTVAGSSAEVIYAYKEDFENMGKAKFDVNVDAGLTATEITFKKATGEIFQGELVGTAIRKADGTPVGFLGCVRDVTEEKLMAERLEEERARSIHSSRMASLGEMAASVGHEINNPLEIINSCASIILREAQEGKNSERLISMSLKIQETVQRIANIISALRTIAREGSGDPVEAVPVQDLLDDILCFSREKFEQRGIELRVQVNLPEGATVNCRRVELSQVLLNLLSNAYDAAKDGKNPWVEIEVSRTNEHLNFDIRDSGAGVSPDVVERIMEPFFTTKPIGEGTGLGLSISQGIAERHGGVLRLLRRRPTTFQLSLPLELKEGLRLKNG